MSIDYAKIITGFDLFEGFTEHGANGILERGEVRHYSAGDALFLENDEPDGAWLVLSGSISIRIERDGRALHFTDATPGTIVGEIGVLCGTRRAACARVTEDCAALYLDASAFRGLLLAKTSLSHRIFSRILRLLVEKERELIASLVD